MYFKHITSRLLLYPLKHNKAKKNVEPAPCDSLVKFS